MVGVRDLGVDPRPDVGRRDRAEIDGRGGQPALPRPTLVTLFAPCRPDMPCTLDEREPKKPLGPLAAVRAKAAGVLYTGDLGIGSNCWIVSGGRTASGFNHVGLLLCQREDGPEALACSVSIAVRKMTAKPPDEGAIEGKKLPPNHAGLSQSCLAPISKGDIEFPGTSLGACDHCENNRTVDSLKLRA